MQVSQLQSQVRALQLQLAEHVAAATTRGATLPAAGAIWDALLRSPEGATLCLVPAQPSGRPHHGDEALKENAGRQGNTAPRERSGRLSADLTQKLADLTMAIRQSGPATVHAQSKARLYARCQRLAEHRGASVSNVWLLVLSMSDTLLRNQHGRNRCHPCWCRHTQRRQSAASCAQRGGCTSTWRSGRPWLGAGVAAERRCTLFYANVRHVVVWL